MRREKEEEEREKEGPNSIETRASEISKFAVVFR